MSSRTSKIVFSSIFAVLVVVITSGSYGKIQVNAQSTQSTQEVQEGGTECEDLHAKWINGDTRGENTTAIEKEFMDKDCWTKLAQLNDQRAANQTLK
jgi:hypothetical protein